MFSKKSFAIDFSPVEKDDPLYCGSFYDQTGQQHLVMGKRSDWLYITDQDRIFTKNQIEKAIINPPESNHVVSYAALKRSRDSKKWQEHLEYVRNDVSLLFVKTQW